MSEEQEQEVVEDDAAGAVIEKVLWVEEDGGARYALGEQLIDEQEQDGEVVKVPSGIVVIAIDELLGADGDVGGDFKIYAKPVDPASPLTQQDLGLALYLPRRRVKKWASVGPLEAMMKARDEAMKVVGDEDDEDEDEDEVVEEEVTDGEGIGSEKDSGDVPVADAQGQVDAGAAPVEGGGAQPVGNGGAGDPGDVSTASGR